MDIESKSSNSDLSNESNENEDNQEEHQNNWNINYEEERKFWLKLIEKTLPMNQKFVTYEKLENSLKQKITPRISLTLIT